MQRLTGIHIQTEIYFLPRQSVRRILLTVLILLSVMRLHAQESEKKITIHVKDATLKEFLKAIEAATDYSFIYSDEVITNHKFTIKVKQRSVEEVLRLAFENKPITYKKVGKHILLQKATPKPKTTGRRFTISGCITDNESSETLIGAHVFEDNHGQGTTSNPYGFYTLTLPEGESHMGFSYLGYTSQVHDFYLRKDTVLNIMLTTDNLLEEVVITSNRSETGVQSTHTGAIDIPMATIRNTPTILGEADVMKTIQLMPGVQSGVEGSAGLYIRGGSPDQNLVLLDGIPIYNIDHVLGFFSVFTPEAVKKVTLFKSSFPARFGGRLSSVIDVRTNDGDMKNYHGTISVGLLTSKFNFEGPVVKDKTSFNLSLRRSYLDLLVRPFMSSDDKLGYYFYDINAKVNHKFSDKNRLYLSVYNGKDELNSIFKDKWGDSSSPSYTYDDIDLKWGNTVIAARWNNILNNKLFSNTTVAYNQYRMDVDSKSEFAFQDHKESYRANYHSAIRDGLLQVDFDYTPVPRHHIKFGGNYIYHRFRPETMTSKASVTEATEEKKDTTYHALSNSRLQAQEISVYAEDNVDFSSRLRANIGVNLSSFHVQGKTYFSLQPRLSARYQWSEKVILKSSYSKMNQYINLLTSAPISMPTDLWVPVTKQIKPMLSHQFTLGGYYTGLPGWEFSLENYYKQMENILEYKDATRFIGSSTSWEEKVEMGKGRSWGVEFMAQRTVGKTTGWFAYTWAKSDRKFSKGGINNGERFPFKYDRRHNINLVVNHKFNDRIDVGASWSYSSGTMMTVAEGVMETIRPYSPGYYYHQPGRPTEHIEKRNNYRLPASHRLNVGVNFHKPTKHGVCTWNVSVYNMYNAMNPNLSHLSYRVEDGDGGYSTPVIKKLTIFPCLPSVTYTYRF